MEGEPDTRPLREEGMAISTYTTSTVFDRELAVAGAGQLVLEGAHDLVRRVGERLRR
jgi:hypothetical protein